MRFTLILGALAATAVAGPACVKHPKKHCETPQGKGLCMDVRDCKGKGSSVAGYCPGGVNFQCCVKDKGDEPSGSEYPTSATETADHTSTTDAPDTTDGTYTTEPAGTETDGGDYSTGTEATSGKGHHTKSGHHSSKPHHTKTTHATTTKPTAATTLKTSKTATTKPTTKKPAPTQKPAPTKPKDGGGHIDDAGLHLIESEEGWRANFYTINGDRTIGYGHDCTQKGDCGSIHAPLSKAEGQKLLAKDVHGFESCVCQLPHASKLNQNQFNALVSFTYNSGCGGVARYFKSYMSKSDFKGICSDLPHTNTLNGLLTGRRTREGKLCKEDTSVMSGC